MNNIPEEGEQPELNSSLMLDEEELEQLAEDIVRFCPSLTQFLLALGDSNGPVAGLN